MIVRKETQGSEGYAMLIIQGNDYGSGKYGSGSAKTNGDSVQQPYFNTEYAKLTEMKKIAVVPNLNYRCSNGEHPIPMQQCSGAESWYGVLQNNSYTVTMAGTKTTNIMFAPSHDDIGGSSATVIQRFVGTKYTFWTRSHAEIELGESDASYCGTSSNGSGGRKFDSLQATTPSEIFYYAPCVWVKYK
jgi:hypothetical protein